MSHLDRYRLTTSPERLSRQVRQRAQQLQDEADLLGLRLRLRYEVTLVAQLYIAGVTENEFNHIASVLPGAQQEMAVRLMPLGRSFATATVVDIMRTLG